MINPVNMTLRQYADALVLSVGDGYAFGRLDDESQWQTFMSGFLRASPTSQQLPPDPYQFSDWRQWAERAFVMLEDHN